MKIIITEQQDEKLTRRVKMMVDKLGLDYAIKMFGNNIEIIRHSYENNPLDYLNNFKDLEIVESPNFPNSIFYLKNGVVVMEQNNKNKKFWFDYDSIWLFFEMIFGMEDQEIKELLTKWLEETFNLKGYIPGRVRINRASWLEETFNLKGYIPKKIQDFGIEVLEETFKLKSNHPL